MEALRNSTWEWYWGRSWATKADVRSSQPDKKNAVPLIPAQCWRWGTRIMWCENRWHSQSPKGHFSGSTKENLTDASFSQSSTFFIGDGLFTALQLCSSLCFCVFSVRCNCLILLQESCGKLITCPQPEPVSSSLHVACSFQIYKKYERLTTLREQQIKSSQRYQLWGKGCFI